jgi:hypothetical protein
MAVEEGYKCKSTVGLNAAPLIVIIEAFSALPAEPTCIDIPAQEHRRSVLGVSSLSSKCFGNVIHCVVANKVGQLQREKKVGLARGHQNVLQILQLSWSGPIG